MKKNMWGQTSLLAIRNHKIRKNLLRRHNLMGEIRAHFNDDGFIEVDTPLIRQWENPAVSLGILNSTKLHLRACIEEYTRRCACAYGKAFEIGKCFRNEELSKIPEGRIHLPEFTMVEFYEIDVGLEESLIRMESILQSVIKGVIGFSKIVYQKRELRFDLPFRRLKVLDAIIKYGDANARLFANRHKKAKPFLIPGEDCMLRDLLDKHVLPNLFEPTFLTHFPKSADLYPDQAIRNEILRAELIIANMEIGEVGCLQFDTDILEEHLMAQLTTQHGTKIAKVLFKNEIDYFTEIRAFNQQVGGGGFGLDRLLMLLCDTSDIHDVVWYPSWTIY